MDADIRKYLVRLEGSIRQPVRFLYFRLPGSRAVSRLSVPLNPSKRVRILISSIERKSGRSKRYVPRPKICYPSGWYGAFLEILVDFLSTVLCGRR